MLVRLNEPVAVSPVPLDAETDALLRSEPWAREPLATGSNMPFTLVKMLAVISVFAIAVAVTAGGPLPVSPPPLLVAGFAGAISHAARTSNAIARSGVDITRR